jgi:hypothetical protein
VGGSVMARTGISFAPTISPDASPSIKSRLLPSKISWIQSSSLVFVLSSGKSALFARISIFVSYLPPSFLLFCIRSEKENAERNACNNIDCYVSDLLSDVKNIDGRPFDIVTANIVADIIIRLAPNVGAFIKEDGLFIASGIIDEREADVDAALTKNGFVKLAAKHEKGWCAVLFKKP